MNFLMCGVRDRSAQFFFPPFFVRSEVEATRTFAKLMDDPNRSGAKSEYELAVLGEFDDQTGLSVPEVVPRVIALGSDFERTSQ